MKVTLRTDIATPKRTNTATPRTSVTPRTHTTTPQRRRTFFLPISLSPFLPFSLSPFLPLLLLLSAFAQPTLRLETGMHTAVIQRVSIDRAGRFLVTASKDKTARVWDAATGELLRTLRPPIGAGNEGKLYAVAVSPDGNTVAAGGWTTTTGFDENIYLFDRESGRIRQRIGNLSTVMQHLEFSPDGRFLAATLGAGGVRLYETNGYRQIGTDADYGGASYGADFNLTGNRLVTSCLDGFLRLYATDTSGGLRLIAKQKVSGGARPFGVKFSPDGNSIAVGFDDTTAVNVLRAADLTLAFAPDTSAVGSGDLSKVAWSSDGSTLYAGGNYQAGGGNPIRSWSNGGRGAASETIAASNTILDIQSLLSGGVIYGAGEPSWGVIDKTNRRARFVTSAVADYRNNRDGLRLSSDGTSVGFGYQDGGKEPARFSVADKQLQTTAGAGSLQPPRTTGLNVTDWKNNYEPKLNGTQLGLNQYETSRSLAIAPDNSRFLLGTEFYLRMFDRTGKQLWIVPAPGAAWSVNIAGDGRTAAAALADGTIRWYRVSDGAELLAFFPHNDKKRWVLWTPTGYYDASTGAEDLIGWHVNNGKDAAADFFPVGLFRSQFYRPDVVSKVLLTADEARAVQIANEEAGRKQQQADIGKQLPPVVEILNPRDGTEVSSTSVRINYNVRAANGEPVTGIKILVDGRPISTERGAGNRPTGASEVTVQIPEKDSEVAIIAENRFAPSIPAVLRLKWRGKPAAKAEEFIIKPKLYVLAIGVGKYANANYNLDYPAKDAQDFTAAMKKQQNGLYREVVVKMLTDEQATRDNIVDGLDWIRLQTTAKDVAMVFLAGHGTNDSLNRYYFLPHNFNAERLASTGVTFSDIKNTVEAIAGKTVFFVDTCHAGNALGTAKTRALPDINGFVNELSSAENGAIVFAASTGKQVSLEDAAWNNGAFTKALVEGLNGKAEIAGKGKITINSLDLYVSERVKELTKGQQTPTTSKPNTVPDFPIAAKY